MAGLGLLVLLAAVLGVSRALNNGLALTPPMGFLNWERFRCNTDCVNDPDNCISEKLFMKMADIIAEEGYRELGYEYIGIDDCWPSKSRDADGNLVADPERFPNGILGLSRYVHSRGLKLGIYEDVGTKTCAGYPGSQDYTKQDAETFAKWELDLLKFDGCNTDTNRSAIHFPLMSQSLNATGRPILYTCEWWSGDQTQHSHYTRNSEYCNSWRTFNDIQDSWPSVLGIIQHYAKNAGDFISVSGPGSINDPDELIIGDFSLSYDQEKTQFGMWAMFAAPLYISADLRTMRPQAKSILQNRAVIAINQDPLVKGANMIKEIQNVQVWLKPLVKPGSYAVAFFNPNSDGTPTRMSLTLADITLTNQNGYNITNVFDDVSMGMYKPSGQFNVTVNPTGIVLVKAMPL
ncbi:alpha-N-acetylgalactosaminidase-like [Haliotis rufescens]|uniref:alpha-N-acetylgalactosaminidase-like n=1 Tax=Haliotis rufescens TaxID=6454 RepID=UPI00201E8F11|nr:alpha-N-acetylgalactosaminidase-like [Haliotis rufescens]